MRKRFRKSIVALMTGTMLLAAATPAAAFDQETNDLNHSVPMLFDILVMRPLGLVMTVGGLALYAFPVAPLTLLTRPADVGKPLGLLVATPGRFTFVDPIGQHPSSD
jgi:hypothetical protein